MNQQLYHSIHSHNEYVVLIMEPQKNRHTDVQDVTVASIDTFPEAGSFEGI